MKDNKGKEFFRKSGYIDIFPFERWWNRFHEVNPQPRVYKLPAKTIYSKINCMGKKRELFKGIEKSKLNAYDYIKSNM